MPRNRLALSLLVVVIAMSAAACRKKVKTAKLPKIGDTETGIASWYGPPYHGRRAANGEIYDMEKLTAAHRTLPFDTWVRVKNLKNDKTVEVRIQDRGPFIDGRIIDLSKAAARNIDMIGPGIVKVRLTVIAPPRDIARQPELFAVQVGSFRDQSRAESLRESMQERYGTARVLRRAGDPPTWRVLVGEESSQPDAEALAARIHSGGNDALVVRLDPVKPEQ